jgi:hypothetical protein
LGSIDGVNGATADTNVGIGTTSPSARLHIGANGGQILIGAAGCSSGLTGIGFASTLAGCNNYSLLGDGADTFVNRPSGGRLFFRESNATQMVIVAGGAVGIGTTTPNDKLDVNGTIRVATLGAGGPTPLCRNASNQLSLCSSSARYKTSINDFRSGLDLIGRLRPVFFRWNDTGVPDVGLVAEDVAKVEPLLVTKNDKGEIEGVKYDRVGVVLINAIKEQQKQIDGQKEVIRKQQERLDRQQAEIDALKTYICSQSPSAAFCKPGK